MIDITPAARERIDGFVADRIVQDPALRIELEGDGRSPLGRAYAISLVDREDRQKTEIAINVDGIRVFLNLDTSNLLSGATVDWTDANGASGFSVSDPRSRPAPPPTDAAALTLSGPMAERAQRVIDEIINPGIAAHGGFVELVDVSDDTLHLRMGGGCQGCAASAATLRQGIERMVRQEIPEIVNVVDVTDHNAGENPYY
jgi:Fe/S biogenesis protein NfuA